ncbi:MAG: response regulator transcription factor [Elusimicrobia bacterium]|nr:response regulator transcription factor [Elusimicrobiota bacterium]
MARLLSIEDDADVQHCIGQALFREGYEVHYAWNGQEGYEKILSLNPDLVILDLVLPLMNGIELLKKMQEGKSIQNIPVIVISGFGDDLNMIAELIKALGAVEFLRKPVDIPELLSYIKHLLSRSPAQAARHLDSSPSLVKGYLRIDPKFRTVWLKDRLLTTLPHKRFKLLKRLLLSPGPVSKEDLLKELGYDLAQADALKKTIQRLREDLGPQESRRLQTTPEGYELCGDSE